MQISDACWSRIPRRHLIRIFTRAARPLHIAAWGRNLAAASLLLSYDATTDAVDMHSGTPLHCAAHCGHHDIAGSRRCCCHSLVSLPLFPSSSVASVPHKPAQQMHLRKVSHRKIIQKILASQQLSPHAVERMAAADEYARALLQALQPLQIAKGHGITTKCFVTQ